MAKNCGCAGGACGCRIIGGQGVTITGTGTQSDPYRVYADDTFNTIGTRIQTSNSTSVEMTKAGVGTPAEPVVLKADVVLRSPNGARWGLAVSNAGVLSAVAL